ncbi:hypothetical protein [Yoonia sp.]|uniref:hypothetical protein n=1 Tax=Yoonia sp. TaxID=2212373 RepID=UPI00391C4A5E
MTIRKRPFYVGMMAIALTTTPAHASICADHDLVVQRLATIYGETRRLKDRGTNETMIEVFVAADTGSWTLTVTGDDGLTCLVAAGQAFDWRQKWLPVLRHAA